MRSMTRAEFARHMGVNRSTVTRWIERGRLTLDNQGRIDPQAATRALEATESPEPHHQARIAQIAEEKAAQAAQGEQDEQHAESREAVAMRLKLAMAREREAKAELAAMECDKQAGLLMDRSEMEYIMRDIGHTFGMLADGLPDRLAPTLAAHHGDVSKIRASLADAMRDMQAEFVHHMERKAEEVLA